MVEKTAPQPGCGQSHGRMRRSCLIGSNSWSCLRGAVAMSWASLWTSCWGVSTRMSDSEFLLSSTLYSTPTEDRQRKIGTSPRQQQCVLHCAATRRQCKCGISPRQEPDGVFSQPHGVFFATAYCVIATRGRFMRVFALCRNAPTTDMWHSTTSTQCVLLRACWQCSTLTTRSALRDLFARAGRH